MAEDVCISFSIGHPIGICLEGGGALVSDHRVLPGLSGTCRLTNRQYLILHASVTTIMFARTLGNTDCLESTRSQ